MATEGEYTYEYERTLEETATWAVATVCFVLLAISLIVEHIIHLVGKISAQLLLEYGVGSI
ncbi:hypothetical protein CRG98_036326 [Punica granatum]|uniref:Uncharacterized protein n=1 Tax=Punica granatum TaxID=22663 RepID=A0A2I0IHR0_PUNGR|nr:hypothetical protein CRG98_036326 [Punica granatum]